MRIVWTVIGVILMARAVHAGEDQEAIAFHAGELTLRVSRGGRVVGLEGPGGCSLLSDRQKPCLFALTMGNKTLAPSALRMDEAAGRLEIVYGQSGVTALVQVESKPTHLRLVLAEVRGARPDLVTILRLPIGIQGRVGGTVGVIRDDRTAVGVQGLNIHTVAGAAKTEWGGLLHASARENQGGVTGAGIALFACPADKALERIGEIELAEGLPHPILDGQWNKLSPTAQRPYLIIPYGLATMDDVLALAQRGGFRFVYHPGPFETWGHFVLHKNEFPEGDKSLRECADKAGKLGIGIGFHTLTSFITTNDAYVTPVPDPRLGRMGSTTLAADVDAAAAEIPVADAAPFQNRQTLATVIMGAELATYEGIAEGPPRLTGVKRGAFGTTASAHRKGDDIGKLADHEYRTFYPGIANGMMDEMTNRLIELGNACKCAQISFDGLEGLATYEGGGEYARNRFVDRCHRAWDHTVISDASNLLHYNWHWHTRMNWGELTQSAKTDVDTYRMKNCDTFRDNLFPAAMGWWRIGPYGLDWEATRMEDVEYLLAKAAGNHATHALSTHVGILKDHGLAGQVLDLVKEWDEARFGGALTEEHCARLREHGKDFQLRRVGEREWELSPVAYTPFYWRCSGEGRKTAAGELTFASAGKPRPQSPFPIQNPYGPQPIRFEIRCLPAYDYGCPENVDLTPADPAALVREAGLHKEAPVLAVVRDGQIAEQPALRLTARYTGAEKPSFVTRFCCALPKPLDLSKNRGLGLWVEGDGKGETLFVEVQDGRNVRPYYIQMDFAGERYIELPLGEVSLKRYYDYEWNNWTGFSSWWYTLKGFRYNHVMMVTLGYNAIPPNTEVSCRVAGIKALRELPARLAKVGVVSGEQKIEFAANLEPFQYLIHGGEGAARVCNPNYHDLRSVAPSGRILLSAGPAEIQVFCDCAGPAPWVRFQGKLLGEPERIAAQ